MKFLNRQNELERLDGLMRGAQGALAVVWGRRRIGKTRLLIEWCRRYNGLYIVADQAAAPVQRRYFAQAVQAVIPGFADVEYPDWRSLLTRLAAEAGARSWRGPLVIDELPYMVVSSPELPSVLQRWIDHDCADARLVVALAGSSQRMMHGIALDASAPLFGRPAEVLRIGSLKPSFARQVFSGCTPAEAVQWYAVFGGVPHYWVLAQPHATIEDALDRLALDPLGPLHAEPERLLLDEPTPTAGARSLLDAIGMGANRASEIAGRVGVKATSLGNYLSLLHDMELIEREVPYGDSEKSGKRSLYRISDPFFRFWFTAIAAHRGMLQTATPAVRRAHCAALLPRLYAQEWETLCRRAVPSLRIPVRGMDTVQWGAAHRFWRGNGPEFDVVARSLDGSVVLIGECKWSARSYTVEQAGTALAVLTAKGIPPISDLQNRPVIRVLFTPQFKGKTDHASCAVVTADTIIKGD